MKINVNYCNNMDKDVLDDLRKQGDKALDYLWEKPFIRDALKGLSDDNRQIIIAHGDRLRNLNGTLIVIARGKIKVWLETFLENLQDTLDKEVVVVGDTLSSIAYEKLLSRCKSEHFSILAIAEGEVSLEERAAYATLKTLILSKYGGEASRDRITFAGTKNSHFYIDQSEGDDLPFISYDEEINVISPAFLLPLYVAGIDIDEIVKGSYDLVASPAWDTYGKDYGVILAYYLKKGYIYEEVAYYFRELDKIASYMENENTHIVKKIEMPGTINYCKTKIQVLLTIEEGNTDIMTPNFPGASEDGSLNLLVKNLENIFLDENEKHEIPTFKLSVETFDAYGIVQLIDYLYLSSEISQYLLNK